MSAEKTYTVAGTATQNGITKVRFANDLVGRVKVLDKNGVSDIQLFELPEPMTKLDALRYLDNQKLDGDAGYAVTVKLAEKIREAKKNAHKVA